VKRVSSLESAFLFEMNVPGRCHGAGRNSSRRRLAVVSSACRTAVSSLAYSLTRERFHIEIPQNDSECAFEGKMERA
jgi:hypothetical protein